VYGPVRTVVWQGSVGNHRPYADQVLFSECGPEALTGGFPHAGCPVLGLSRAGFLV